MGSKIEKTNLWYKDLSVVMGEGGFKIPEKKLEVIYGGPLVYQSLLTTTTTIYLYLATLDNHFSVTIVERGIATHTRQPPLYFLEVYCILVKSKAI